MVRRAVALSGTKAGSGAAHAPRPVSLFGDLTDDRSPSAAEVVVRLPHVAERRPGSIAEKRLRDSIDPHTHRLHNKGLCQVVPGDAGVPVVRCAPPM